MVRELDEQGDWAELCTFINGVHEEVELTPVQFAVVDALLGLSTDAPFSDDYLVGAILPTVVEAASAAEAAKG